MTVTDIATRPTGAIQGGAPEWSIEQMVNQSLKIQQLMSEVLKRDEHYGVIPGTQGRDGKPPKPTLLKPGAEKLCLMFRLDPEYETITATETQQLFAYTIRCVLFHIPTGQRIASGLGSCNSRETKYVRPAPKVCPKCNAEAIIKGKEEYGGGWLCFAKKGGCGGKWKDGDDIIEKQPAGIADPSDLANTILKMACKRALIAAVLNGTAASDCFTQDLEDLTEKAAEYTPPKAEEYAPPKAPAGGAPASASGTAPTGVRIAATTGSGSKAPRADSVKHDGTFAGTEQVKLLHILRSKVGGLVVCGDKNPCSPPKRCAYHVQLAAFKDCDGKPIGSSKDLSDAQIMNLIGRYRAKIDQQGARAAEPIDIGAIGHGDPTRGLDAMAVADLRTKLIDQDFVEQQWCESLFGVERVDQLTKADGDTALQLLLARMKGPDDYDYALEAAREKGLVPPR
jgi:hypothetical protein